MILQSDCEILEKVIETKYYSSGTKGRVAYLLILTKYGICKIAESNWSRGTKPTIESAIDKTAFFKAMASEVHDVGRYTYLGEYTSTYTKITIRCDKGHEFLQTPKEHLQGSGCPHCAGKYKTHEDFVEKSNLVHNGAFEYVSRYVKSGDKVLIKHKVCGKTFEQIPSNHQSGSGCPHCTHKIVDTEITIGKFNVKHDFRYDYCKFKYINTKVLGCITCKIHGDFWQIPNNHMNGAGCPSCNLIECRWNRAYFIKSCERNNNGIGKLYVIKCFNEVEDFYKIGLTSKTVKTRYCNKTLMPYNYEIVQEVNGFPESLWDFEVEIKRYIRNSGLMYLPNIPFGGSKTECYKL